MARGTARAMPEGRRPPPGACEKPRAGTFAVARGKRRSAGERACEWRTQQECGQSVRGRTGKRRSTGSGSAMGKRGKSADEPFSVARGSAGRRGRGACEWRTRQEGGQAVFGRAEEAQVSGRTGSANGGRGKREGNLFAVARGKRRSEGVGLQMGGRGKGTDEPFAVASGKRNGHWDRWEDWVGECGQGHAGWSGQALAGKRALRGRGWGKNAWAGALRLRDRKNRAREGCPPAAPHI